MKDCWQNNLISKVLNEEYEHDFSICDIDGACRKFYKENNIWKTRLVIYESKYNDEKITQTQLATLYSLMINIKWENYDNLSGVYVIRHDEFLQELKIHKIFNKYEDASYFVKPEYDIKLIKIITMNDFYNWISVKDIE